MAEEENHITKGQEGSDDSVVDSSIEKPNSDLKSMDKAALRLTMGGKHHSTKVLLAESGGMAKRKKPSPQKNSGERQQEESQLADHDLICNGAEED